MKLDPLNEWLEELERRVNEGWRPSPDGYEHITGPFGRHGVLTDFDEDGDEYVLIGFVIHSKNVFADIGVDGTYGNLQSFRIYTGQNEDDLPKEQETMP